MVSEFKEGLEKGGVPEELITIEKYFNHKMPVNDDVVNIIAAAVSLA